MSHESPLIVAVGNDPGSRLCRLIKCVDNYSGYVDVAICLKQCRDIKAPIIINVTNCNWGGGVVYGNVTLKSIKCCSTDCVKIIDNNIVITGYVPKVYMGPMAEVLIKDVTALWRSTLTDDAVNRISRRILAERSSLGLSKTLMGLVRMLKSGDASGLDEEVLMILETLGIVNSGILMDKDKLRSLIEEVSRIVYP
ncbi:hypothetical protein [Caldivirga maquilingensis]|uniref:Uncharacterized protein n=1 Tax=Caldivirga maquilingensis (strain ATCC 700844 / DSM 13496 / JCM 10307 / IC-167) TaxID=397948 RepID=A8MA96_CALMQ|nr:hypothetical protein [Caldivirga maquilingensis]ABW01028.1 hypothetical protein Cmaq_0179 [Caldivirga maquilingensis IC-167]